MFAQSAAYPAVSTIALQCYRIRAVSGRRQSSTGTPSKELRLESEETMIEEIESRQGNVHPSPPLGILAVVFLLLFAASIATNFIMTDFAPYPTPYLPIN
jgi:hypothetical protein